MKRYRKNRYVKSSIKSVETFVGETIEQKIERLMHNAEGIEGNDPLIYQERKDGINPMYDPRTDRFEVAIDAMDKVTANFALKRANMQLIKNDMNDSKGEPTDGTQGGEKSTKN